MYRPINRSFVVIAGFAVSLAASSASAGFVFNTGRDFVRSIRAVQDRISIDDPFITDGFAGFISYVPDSPDDPAIHPADLETYKYQLNGSVSAAGPSIVIYSGDYSIVIDLRPLGSPDVFISTGTFVLFANYITPTYATLSGEFIQNAGPQEGGVFDLTYGISHPLFYSGEYFETDPGFGGEMIGQLAQTIPAVGTLPLLIGALAAASRRRR